MTEAESSYPQRRNDIDVVAIASTAEDKGDHWLLNGSKTWLSNADVLKEL